MSYHYGVPPAHYSKYLTSPYSSGEYVQYAPQYDTTRKHTRKASYNLSPRVGGWYPPAGSPPPYWEPDIPYAAPQDETLSRRVRLKPPKQESDSTFPSSRNHTRSKSRKQNQPIYTPNHGVLVDGASTVPDPIDTLYVHGLAPRRSEPKHTSKPSTDTYFQSQSRSFSGSSTPDNLQGSSAQVFLTPELKNSTLIRQKPRRASPLPYRVPWIDIEVDGTFSTPTWTPAEEPSSPIEWSGSMTSAGSADEEMTNLEGWRSWDGRSWDGRSWNGGSLDELDRGGQSSRPRLAPMLSTFRLGRPFSRPESEPGGERSSVGSRPIIFISNTISEDRSGCPGSVMSDRLAFLGGTRGAPRTFDKGFRL